MGENGGLSASDVALITDRGGNNGGFGGWGDSSFFWIFALLILANGGFGNGGFGNNGGGGFGGGFGGYYGNMMLGYDFPWLLNGQNGINANTNAGFAQAATQSAINGLQNAVTSGFGDVQTALCGGFAGVNQNICSTGNGIVNAVNSGFANAESSANARQIANMQQAFASQTAITGGLSNLSSQLAQCCCDNRLANCQTNNTIISEGAATRFADANNTRDIIQSQTAGTQAILDKLCQLEIDGVRSELAAERRQNENLRSDLMYARGQASQIEQTAQILAGQQAEIDGVYNRLKNCPVPSMPVYGNTPIFTCQGNNYGGCGCNGNI